MPNVVLLRWLIVAYDDMTRAACDPTTPNDTFMELVMRAARLRNQLDSGAFQNALMQPTNNSSIVVPQM